jgi:hypothetical protein
MAGAEQTQTWAGGLSQENLARIALEEGQVELGRIYSDSSMAEKSERDLVATLDGLLGLFGIDRDNWTGAIVSGRGTVTTFIGVVFNHEYSKEDLESMAASKGLGEFVLERSLWAVPIGGDEDQDGNFSLSLELCPEVVATIHSYGQQETYRKYLDPKTREQVEGEQEKLEKRVENDELISDIDKIHTDINYRVYFSSSAVIVD